MRAPALLLLASLAAGCSGNGLTADPSKTGPGPLRTILLSCCAQIPAIAPEALPPSAALLFGDAFQGVLSGDDLRFLSGAAFDVFSYDVQPGERVRFELSSEAFDPLLVAVTPSGLRVHNDDADDGTDAAHIETDTPGTWRLLASGATADASGPYVLAAVPRPTPRGAAPPPPLLPFVAEGEATGTPAPPLSGTLAPGDATLDGRGFFDEIEVEVASGETVTVEVSSSAFVPDAVAVSPGGEVPERETGPWRSTVRLAEPGTWRVAILSLMGPDRGPYTVTIRR